MRWGGRVSWSSSISIAWRPGAGGGGDDDDGANIEKYIYIPA